MREFELTTEHKKKLLEMCRELYPEFNQLWGYKMVHDYMKEYHPDKNTSISAMETRKLGLRKPVWLIGGDNVMLTCHLETMVCIHWFEFCITYLSHKLIFTEDKLLRICNHNHAELLKSVMAVFYGEKQGIHPVDYLYEQFKKL